jgi:hypothetical protein
MRAGQASCPSGFVCISKPKGITALSEPFDIAEINMAEQLYGATNPFENGRPVATSGENSACGA